MNNIYTEHLAEFEARGAEGFRVLWPVNPHFTGSTMIIDLLPSYGPLFTNATITERKAA